jgi:hypothetical protein
MPLNRVVVLLTPLFAGIAGWLVQWIADHFPGAPNLESGELTALFIAGFLAAAEMARQWLKGHVAHEKNLTDIALHGSPPEDRAAAQKVVEADESTLVESAKRALAKDDGPKPEGAVGGKPSGRGR